MNNDNVDYLPIWKKNATPEERLLEIAAIARKFPERFSKFVVVYQEETETHTAERYVPFNTNTVELLGILRLAEESILRRV